jgi:acyl-CoA thioesterase I
MKIVILADSLVMPRYKEIPYDVTYGYLLDHSLKKIYRENAPMVMEHGMRARTILDVARDWFELVTLKSPEIVILHIGIADCAPRLLLQKEHEFVDRIRPIKLRNKFLDYLSENRRRLITLFPNRVYVPFAIFKERFNKIIKLAETNGVKRLIVINILRPTDELEFKSPGFKKNVDLYNAFLYQSSIDRPMISFVDLDKVITENGGVEALTTDGIHINPQGHALLAGHLQTLIMEIFPEVPVLEGSEGLV